MGRVLSLSTLLESFKKQLIQNAPQICLPYVNVCLDLFYSYTEIHKNTKDLSFDIEVAILLDNLVVGTIMTQMFVKVFVHCFSSIHYAFFLNIFRYLHKYHILYRNYQKKMNGNNVYKETCVFVLLAE